MHPSQKFAFDVGVITSLFLGIGFVALFYFSSGLFAGIIGFAENTIARFSFCSGGWGSARIAEWTQGDEEICRSDNHPERFDGSNYSSVDLLRVWCCGRCYWCCVGFGWLLFVSDLDH